MNLAFCLNVFVNEFVLYKNIEHINKYFPGSKIFIASNNLEKPNWLPENATFWKWCHTEDPKKFEDWQLGALNGAIASLNLASKNIKDFWNWKIIFTHDDNYPLNPDKINKELEDLGNWDLICREWLDHKYIGEHIMIETFFLNGLVLPFFCDFSPVEEMQYCAEITFGNIVKKFRKKKIPTPGCCNEENELGFYHDHPRLYLEKKDSSLTILTHTHSDCEDIWAPYFSSIKRYFTNNYTKKVDHVVVTNKIVPDASLIQYLYDDKEPFSNRLKEPLANIKTPFCLFMLEDYIPYAPIQNEMVTKFLKKMEEDKEISFIRLLQSGATYYSDYDEDLYQIHPDEYYLFSTQATIWRTDVLSKLVNECVIPTVRHEPQTSPFLKTIARKGLCVKDRGRPVGGHYDSKCFPYIATACVAGKWNTSEYPGLLNILEEHGIDPNIRGCR